MSHNEEPICCLIGIPGAFHPSFPCFTWDCADELEGRLKKTLYHGGKNDCMAAVSPVALTDLAVSIYLAAAPSPKRKLNPGYIGSIAKRLAINPCTMMLGILYCERLRQVNPEYLKKISSADLFVVSLVVASKFLNDEGEDDEIFNDEWAEAGGLGVSTVNRLEREFLDAMHWKAYVSPKEFFGFCNQLETRIALKHGLLRGWFSYTDLTNILAQMHYLEAVKNAVQKTFQVFIGCTVMYGLSLTVLISSIICMNASLKAKDIGTTNANVLSDRLHPFAEREITRQRQTVDSAVNTGEETPREIPCSCMKASANTRLDQRKIITSSIPCRCGVDWSHGVSVTGKGLKFGTFDDFQSRISCNDCSMAHVSNSRFSKAINGSNDNNNNNNEIRSHHRNGLMSKKKSNVRHEGIKVIGDANDNYDRRVAIHTSKGCVSSGKALSVQEKAVYISTIVEDMKNHTTINKDNAHEILLPIKQLPMLNRGVFVNRGVHTMISGFK
eukprot:Seg1293.2 transcript_id=Seg1293.2/GoldUCD/mRNA.D3Y31 product="Protein CNPPD1" protein_id=Seg1293.2/GoldUCD/D3Y31